MQFRPDVGHVPTYSYLPALPCYRVGGKILVRRSEFDAWIAQYQYRGRPELARTLREMGLDNADV